MMKLEVTKITVKIRSIASFLNEQKEEDQKELELDEIDLLLAIIEDRINKHFLRR